METKDVTGWLGIEATDLESFKKAFEQKYFTEEQVFKDSEKLSKFTGKTLGKIKAEIVRIARAQGVEFEKTDIEDKPLEEITNVFLTKQAESFTSKIEDLQKVASAGGDEKVKEWQTKFEKLENKYKDTESAWKNTVAEFDGFKQTAAQQVKGVKLDYVRSNVWNGIKFDPSVDPLKRKGFEATIKEQFVIDLDENDAPFIATKDGKRIQNPTRHDQFLSVEEVLNTEAEKAGLTAKNQNAGRPAFLPQGQSTIQPEGKPVRKLSNRALNF